MEVLHRRESTRTIGLEWLLSQLVLQCRTVCLHTVRNGDTPVGLAIRYSVSIVTQVLYRRDAEITREGRSESLLPRTRKD